MRLVATLVPFLATLGVVLGMAYLFLTFQMFRVMTRHAGDRSLVVRLLASCLWPRMAYNAMLDTLTLDTAIKEAMTNDH